MKGKILIVDDQVKVYKSLARNFTYLGYQTIHAKNRKEAIGLFSKDPSQLVLLDIMLGKDHGIDVLQELLLFAKNTPVIMITGHGSIDTAVQSMKLGAFDYVTKPVDFDKLAGIVEKAMKVSNPQTGNHFVQDMSRESSPRLITQNTRMLELHQKVRKLAITNLPILITGENGTGKEIVADLIHIYSQRSSQTIHKINCAAFPETLLDNELFGHEKGAYTGADSTFQGVFERAHSSSLFFDEIGDMPLTIQAKILRTLQNHEIRRIGGERTITVDVRFIAATNKNLQELIEEKVFRKDLFYRLNTAKLHIPPLRERKEDIPPLVEHFLSEYAFMNSTSVRNVSEDVLGIFLDYDWPGNIRELKNSINYAAAISSEDCIDVDALPPDFLDIPQKHTPANTIEDVEKNLIVKMLQKTNYNKKKTAELLNVSRNTLYNKLEKYGISLSR
ncbi:MAG: sigma-54-dependent Fis family transcriptional regulator [bacterium]|nr:sigma-54-dependent Fis family transcriptional regulator [bacterium]